ncbi:MAG: murein biosynthesis integral membrane protein MurJ [Opitutae bacterium]|jgi:putative peptidoglycan lipid II flippase|nr:murein biosynthesis integral membrane protein MurJ [Opitutae bacterium]
MSKFSRNLSLVSGLTALSRILGLFRDILFFSFFGSSAVAAAFILAFTLPNLFRRMLGEGTLSSAFIPVYAENLQSQGLTMANRILNQVLSRLGLLLLLLSLIVCLLSWLGWQTWLTDEKWKSGAFLNAIVFPYVLFICMSAVLVGALNTHRSFFAGAFSPIILNLSMIGSMIIGKWGLRAEGMELATSLCVGVVVGGLLQLSLPWIQLRSQKGWNWNFDLRNSEQLGKIKTLFWVGALGAAVAQVNVLVSRVLAYSLDDQGALPYLFLSARLIELPLGVFAIALSTVLFPELARSSGLADTKGFENHFARGFRLTLSVTLPAAIGLGLLAEPILSVLFQYGLFAGDDVDQAARVLMVSVIALPFYALSAFIVKAFHARKQMKPPLFAAIASFVINLVLCLSLMGEYGVMGLAWANVGAAFAQLVFLLWQLKEIPLLHYLKPRPFFVLGGVLSSLVMGIAIFFLRSSFETEDSRIGDLWTLCLLIPVGLLIHFLVLVAFGFPEAKGAASKLRLVLGKFFG